MSYEIKRSRQGRAWPLGGRGAPVQFANHYSGYMAPERPTTFVLTPGIDFGGQKGQPKVKSEPVPGRFYVVVNPGTTQWSSVGETTYYQTTYYLLEARDGRWQQRAVVEPGKQWSKAVKELEALALELAKEGD